MMELGFDIDVELIIGVTLYWLITTYGKALIGPLTLKFYLGLEVEISLINGLIDITTDTFRLYSIHLGCIALSGPLSLLNTYYKWWRYTINKQE